MSALEAYLPAQVRSLRGLACLVAAALAATIIGAWIFEAAGYAPCKLCLEQRYAYYAGIPLAALAALVAPAQPKLSRLILLIVGLMLAANAVFGVYHAGVEWGWWAGPTDCAPTGAGGLSGNAGSLLQQMQTARVVNCSQAALRILGLSLAGWNAVICAILAAVCLRAAARGRA